MQLLCSVDAGTEQEEVSREERRGVLACVGTALQDSMKGTNWANWATNWANWATNWEKHADKRLEEKSSAVKGVWVMLIIPDASWCCHPATLHCSFPHHKSTADSVCPAISADIRPQRRFYRWNLHRHPFRGHDIPTTDGGCCLGSK